MSQSDPEFTQVSLQKIFGWRLVKEAKALCDVGAVMPGVEFSGSASPVTWRGKVKMGARTTGVILRRLAGNDWAASCSCATARRGEVCGHALALVFAHQQACTEPENGGKDGLFAKTAKNVKTSAKNSESKNINEISLIIPKLSKSFSNQWKNNTLYVEFQYSTAAEYNLESLGWREDSSSWRSWLVELGFREGERPPYMLLQGELAARFLRILQDLEFSPPVGADGVPGRWIEPDPESRPGPLLIRRVGDKATVRVAGGVFQSAEPSPNRLGQGGGAWLEGPEGWSVRPPGEHNNAWEWRPPADSTLCSGADGHDPALHRALNDLRSAGMCEVGSGLLPDLLESWPGGVAGGEDADGLSESEGDRVEWIEAEPGIAGFAEGSLNALTLEMTIEWVSAPGDEISHHQEPLTDAGPSDNSPRHETTLLPDLADEPGVVRILRRRPERIAPLLQVVRSAGFVASPEKPGEWRLKGEEAIVAFLAARKRLFPAPEWRISLGERIRHVTRRVRWLGFELQFSGKQDCPDSVSARLELRPSGGGKPIPIGELTRAARMGSAIVRRGGDGSLLAFDLRRWNEVVEAWRDIGPTQPSPGEFRFDPVHLDYLESSIGAGDVGRGTGSARRRLDADEVTRTLPPAVRDRLRPYQIEGVRWLAEQAANGLGALLADDMGLGKTLQSLCLVHWLGVGHRKRQQSRKNLPERMFRALVVCPASLLGTWQDESACHFPEMNVCRFHGAGRMDRGIPDDCDLVITSYGSYARDLDFHQQRSYDLILLDEASQIRNPGSQIAKALFSIPSRLRVALSGTPVENSVRDLWSIFRFLQPGYLGAESEFEQRYLKPMARHEPDPAIEGRLRRRVSPFLLRRTKSEVATDLPRKIIQTLHCEMSAEAQKAYHSILSQMRKNINLTTQKETSNSNFQTFAALTKLRLACCDLSLVRKNTKELSSDFLLEGRSPSQTESEGKRAAFREILGEAMDGGHRALVFSQFTSMLELLREDVQQLGVEPAWLTGASTDRDAQVRRFQNRETPVFLLSTKAGGYGLTLTAADTVILYEPWWNPAVEDQAMDRAHRIGQRAPVTVYRLIVRHSIEEAILKLQERKRRLASGLVGAGGGLSAADLKEILM